MDSDLRRGIGRFANRIADWAEATPGSGAANSPALAPLTPEFNPEQHQTYVDHLNTAVKGKRTCNIALTGTYGAGKSSVLQEFARQNGDRVLFLSLSTLGPDAVGESRTNQIEKELVKQLLHREKPAQLPQSRYQRIDRLSKSRAASEAAVALLVLGIALWLFGVFPKIPGLSDDNPVWTRIGACVVVGVAAISLLTGIRLALHNRFEVAELSAGGASISLTKSESYFDEYLDEIVYFFESMRKVEIVIFEDLDRFDEPGIFEALRELNTLLNNSKQTDGRAIRFVYALRDSIFEKLGNDTTQQVVDAAAAETVRANRTKFFDVVIPIVPFITHRTSRDLLTQLLAADDVAPNVTVSAQLIDLTARHLPDMRLLVNIRNEYCVYSKRLITDKRGVQPLEANKLFAMVVYKNIHLADFEHALKGRSDLDSVYRLSRAVVTESITGRRSRLRQISDSIALREAIAERATSWGASLQWFFDKIAENRHNGGIQFTYMVGDRQFESEAIGTSEFWQELLNTDTGVTGRLHHPYQSQYTNLVATMDDLRRLLGGSLQFEAWDSAETVHLEREAARLRADLEVLRTVDFKNLSKRTDFTLIDSGEHLSFKDLVAKNVKSEVGRALIAEGFIDRYYSLYIAQYYGDHVPPNSMSFILQNVDTNRSDINYTFHDPEEIVAVLQETNRSFLSEISAYNIGILDHLLGHADPDASTVLNSIISHTGEPEQAFLQAYLSAGTNAKKAVADVAGRWADVFKQIIEEIDLTHEKRIELVNVALANADNNVDYELNESIRDYLQNIYKTLPILTETTNANSEATDFGADLIDLTEERKVRNAVNVMMLAGLVCDDLAVLSPAACRLVVESDCYVMTAANLRTALGDPATLSLDRIQAISPGIYTDVLNHPDRYLQAIADDIDLSSETMTAEIRGARSGIGLPLATRRVTGDSPSRTKWTVEEQEKFAVIVTDMADYSTTQAAAVISGANPDCIIEDLSTVPDSIWEALARCHRFSVTLTNVDAYVSHRGEIDIYLAEILTSAGSIAVPFSDQSPESDDESGEQTSDTKLRVAESILSASETISDPTVRVRLVASLGLEDWFPIAKIKPERGRLLGLLIGERVCADELALFAHFETHDWETLCYAIERSTSFTTFVTPQILDVENTSQLFASTNVNADVKRAVLRRFDEYVPSTNPAALSAAGNAALTTATCLAASSIATIASGTKNADLVVQLLAQCDEELGLDEVTDALRMLPAPHNEITNSSANTLIFPRDTHHASVLKRLHLADRITMRAYPQSLRKPARIEVKVL
ncbi:YobI family P-loop NTPase [Rhodococcus qingshengii]|uniref:YobI family P-loop NTPase n=1 Tax=Rhodococcus qingshengii TaxID=334542 RepID=UPI0019583DD2|nr:hypothetical protein [Rhodococcus qingshengii]QXC45205.1 hypothetical protein KSE96_11895 [Rhodococcus qingshengii]